MTTKPYKEIWLQVDPDGDHHPLWTDDGTTWCEDKMNDTDVRYVLASDSDLVVNGLRLRIEQVAESARTAQVASRRKLGVLQARIDALMLEFCPDEMTLDQLANWAAHQRAAPEYEPLLAATKGVME